MIYTLSSLNPYLRHARRSESVYDINGYQRIYLCHIPKTSGTSLNFMMLALAGGDASAMYSKLVNNLGHRISTNGLIYVGWNRRFINEGSYFYGFSHEPFHQLKLPKGTFTIACFRDPVQRILSFYNMLMQFSRDGTKHPSMRIYGKSLGKGFDYFLDHLPRKVLQGQLHMFSKNFDISEAVTNTKKLEYYFFSENFSDGIRELNKKTGLDLKPLHIRQASYHATNSDSEILKLRNMLDEEYRFINLIRECKEIRGLRNK